MRRIVVTTFVSVDGVMQAPGAPDEDRDGGFAHGGWTVPHFDDRVGEWMTETVGRAGALLLGRRTYDIFAASWPLADPGDPIATVLNRVPKHVASRTLGSVSWHNSTLLGDDVPAAVADLKRGSGGEIQVHGSGGLVQTLIRHDLVDEFQVLVFPVLLGPGKRLFGSGAVPAGLRLTGTVASRSGVVLSRYARAGEVGTGAMGAEFDWPGVRPRPVT
jgi:dihydrofolate reductase